MWTCTGEPRESMCTRSCLSPSLQLPLCAWSVSTALRARSSSRFSSVLTLASLANSCFFSAATACSLALSLALSLSAALSLLSVCFCCFFSAESAAWTLARVSSRRRRSWLSSKLRARILSRRRFSRFRSSSLSSTAFSALSRTSLSLATSWCCASRWANTAFSCATTSCHFWAPSLASCRSCAFSVACFSAMAACRRATSSCWVATSESLP
mmetsp:Transcript_49534/g.116295  ORF Transcript_49534/g.116295 Transcript_49534/m.116295 type:complete len:212 (-) Transcript_49534:811-1446(-)